MTRADDNPIVLLSSPEMSEIAKTVAASLGADDSRYSQLEVEYTTFANGEIVPRLPETVRSKDVYFFHSLHLPDPNTSFIKMLLTSNAVRLASARSLVLVILYIPYLRQDRKDRSRVPVSARVIADIIETNKTVKRIVTMDMHADQEEGFFSIPVDNMRGRGLHSDYFKKIFGDSISEVMAVAPDFGSAVRTRRFADLLGENVPVAILEKERSGGKVKTYELIGDDPKGKRVILYDDMIDSGGTIIAASHALMERGAKEIYVCATHGIFSASGGTTAEEKFSKAGVQVVVTDSIPRTPQYCEANKSWLTVLPTHELITKVLQQSDHSGGSVSKLF